MTATVLTAVALALGMDVLGNGVEVVGLFTLALLVNMVALCLGGRHRDALSDRSRPARSMQMPVFLILFFAPVYVPLDAAVTAGSTAVATLNPVTYLLEAGREPRLRGAGVRRGRVRRRVLPARSCFAVWAALGMRRAEAAGG